MLIVDFPIGCEVADDVIDGFDGEDVGPAVRKVSCGLSCPLSRENYCGAKQVETLLVFVTREPC